jgi:presqualene diphosphate synthase
MTPEIMADAESQQTKSVATRSSFYLAMRVLEPERRQAMFAIYAFCRAVDDIADEEGEREERAAQLDEWRKDLDELYAGRVHRRCASLAEPVRRYALKREDFEAIIDGMAMDVASDICAPDWATLDLYCDRVASAVGRLSVHVFGLDEEPGRRLAHHLGRALQLTNILRDLDEDAQRGRLYLPREALERAGVAVAAPEAILAHPNLGAACAEVAARAREHFEIFREISGTQPRRLTKAPYLMSVAYASILDRLVSRGFTPPRTPVKASRVKIFLALLLRSFS